MERYSTKDNHEVREDMAAFDYGLSHGMKLEDLFDRSRFQPDINDLIEDGYPGGQKAWFSHAIITAAFEGIPSGDLDEGARLLSKRLSSWKEGVVYHAESLESEDRDAFLEAANSLEMSDLARFAEERHTASLELKPQDMDEESRVKHYGKVFYWLRMKTVTDYASSLDEVDGEAVA